MGAGQQSSNILIMKKKKTRYYVASEIERSCDIYPHIQNLLERERSTYRVMKPEKGVTPKERREGSEVTKTEISVQMILNDKEVTKKIPFLQFDKKSWRFYLEVDGLEDLNDFFEEIENFGIPFSIKRIPADPEEEFIEFMEQNFGLEEIEGHIIYFHDMLLDDEEEYDFVGEGEEEEDDED